MRTLRSLARLDLDELRDELPPATVEALLHRLLLCIETQAGAALSVCADAVVGNELSVVRWHFVYPWEGIHSSTFPELRFAKAYFKCQVVG